MSTDARPVGTVVTWVLLLSLSLGGCGLTPRQEAAVGQFGAGSADLGETARQQFVDSRQDVIEMNRLRRELGDDVDSLEGQLTAERVRVRVRAMAALQRYGELLISLAEREEGPALRAASASFMDSLRRVEGVNVDDEQAGAIVQAMAAVGGLWIDAKRQRATEEAVEWAHPHVTRLADLVEESFDAEGEAWSLAFETTTTALTGAATIAEQDLDGQDVSGRALVQQAKDTATVNQDEFEATSQQVVEAARAMAEAHRDLRNLLRAEGVTVEQLDGFLDRMDELAETYAILRR